MIVILLQVDSSQWSLVTQQVQHVTEFRPWMMFGRPPLLAQCVDRDVRLYYVDVLSLVYGCGNVPQTTAESSDTPPTHCAQHDKREITCSPEPARTIAKLHQNVEGAWENELHYHPVLSCVLLNM